MAEQAEGSFFRPARVSFDVLIKKALASCIFGVCATLISSVCVGVCACANECVGISMCTLSYFLSCRQDCFTSCLFLQPYSRLFFDQNKLTQVSTRHSSSLVFFPSPTAN